MVSRRKQGVDVIVDASRYKRVCNASDLVTSHAVVTPFSEELRFAD
jgi:hypothetical protein